MELAKRTGLIVIFVIFLTGILACFDLYTKLNIKSAVYGYFYSEPEVIQINDFEYDITSLLFTNTGTENQYIAKATTKAVSGFDKNKKYTATINNNLCSTTTNTDYINVTFTNQFNSTSDNIILTDELNIKINFYKDGTQLVFITNNGEKAVKLWSSYISKHGFKIKLVESGYTGQIQADNLPKYQLTLYANDEIYQVINFDFRKNFELPADIDGYEIKNWKDEENNIYTKETLPLADKTLYADFVLSFSGTFSQDNLETISYYGIGDDSAHLRYQSDWLKLNDTVSIELFETFSNSDLTDGSNINDLLQFEVAFNLYGYELNFDISTFYTASWCDCQLNFKATGYSKMSDDTCYFLFSINYISETKAIQFDIHCDVGSDYSSFKKICNYIENDYTNNTITGFVNCSLSLI